MAKLSINLGTNPNDGTGDNLRGGGTKINDLNEDEINSAIKQHLDPKTFITSTAGTII